MVQAGKLVPIEEALASCAAATRARHRRLPRPRRGKRAPAFAARPPGPRRSRWSAKKRRLSAARDGPPSPDDDWRAKLHTAMIEAGLQFSADAIAQSEVPRW
jgi:hypothetical protein